MAKESSTGRSKHRKPLVARAAKERSASRATNGSYEVADSAKLQVQNLPHVDKRALHDLFTGDRASGESQPMEGGHYVARMGNRRVLWQPDAEGRPVILSVLDHSYAARA